MHHLKPALGIGCHNSTSMNIGMAVRMLISQALSCQCQCGVNSLALHSMAG